MTSLLCRFLNDEQGQDLIEYTLLLAFVCLASAALFISVGGSVSGIWSATPRWTPENRPVVDTSKPASGPHPEQLGFTLPVLSQASFS